MNTNKNRFFRFVVVTMLYTIIGWAACTPMDHYYSEFAKLGDRVYVGKLDSVWLYSGYNRVKLAWESPSDPSVNRVVVYWNANRDSVEHTVDKTLDTGAIIIEGLAEGLQTLNAVTYDSKGNRSLTKEISVEVYGDRFQENTVRNRTIESVFIRSDSVFVNWFEEFAETMVRTEFTYSDLAGTKHTVSLPTDSLQLGFSDIDLAKDVSYRSFFSPSPLALDFFVSEEEQVNLQNYETSD